MYEILKTSVGAAMATALLTGCIGGVYKSPDVAQRTESGETQYVADAKEFESGIIKAFPDIPIPATHKIDLQQSVIFTSPTQTMGKIALTGSGDVDSLYRFFEKNMPEQGWSLVNAFQSSTSSMYFAKPGKFVAIIIEGTGKSGSRVLINIGPE